MLIATITIGNISIMRFLPLEEAPYIAPLVGTILIVLLVLSIIEALFPIIVWLHYKEENWNGLLQTLSWLFLTRFLWEWQPPYLLQYQRMSLNNFVSGRVKDTFLLRLVAQNILARLQCHDNVVSMRSHFLYWRHLLEHRNQRNRLIQL